MRRVVIFGNSGSGKSTLAKELCLAEDANLAMLLDWIAEYTQRDDTFSQTAHEALFNGYSGKRTVFTSNDRGQLI